MVQKSDEGIYSKLNMYMHISYVNGEDRWPKKLSDAWNLLVNWKEGKRPPTHQYESSKGVELKTKGNLISLRVD